MDRVVVECRLPPGERNCPTIAPPMSSRTATRTVSNTCARRDTINGVRPHAIDLPSPPEQQIEPGQGVGDHHHHHRELPGELMA